MMCLYFLSNMEIREAKVLITPISSIVRIVVKCSLLVA